MMGGKSLVHGATNRTNMNGSKGMTLQYSAHKIEKAGGAPDTLTKALASMNIPGSTR